MEGPETARLVSRLASVREAGLRPFWQRMNFDRTESLGETLREGPTPG